jgi:hypothetical protein
VIIEEGINPNCSEATIRILLKNQDEAKISQLIHKLRLEMSESYDFEEKPQDWDGQKEEKEFDMSEGYIDREEIFGMDVLKITGDAPYNYSNEIDKIISRFLPKAKVEWSEP